MKIPKRIKIGGIIYDVNKTREPVVLGDRVCYGVIDYDQGEIALSNSYSDQKMEQVFLHETLHGIAHDRNLTLGDKEEEIIDTFAVGLHNFIIDNPGIFK
jgi:hypothetical protein